MSKIGFLNVNPVSGNTIPTTITIVPDAYTSEKQQTLLFRNTKGKIARCLVTCTPKVKQTYIVTPHYKRTDITGYVYWFTIPNTTDEDVSFLVQASNSKTYVPQHSTTETGATAAYFNSNIFTSIDLNLNTFKFYDYKKINALKIKGEGNYLSPNMDYVADATYRVHIADGTVAEPKEYTLGLYDKDGALIYRASGILKTDTSGTKYIEFTVNKNETSSINITYTGNSVPAFYKYGEPQDVTIQAGHTSSPQYQADWGSDLSSTVKQTIDLISVDETIDVILNSTLAEPWSFIVPESNRVNWEATVSSFKCYTNTVTAFSSNSSWLTPTTESPINTDSEISYSVARNNSTDNRTGKIVCTDFWEFEVTQERPITMLTLYRNVRCVDKLKGYGDDPETVIGKYVYVEYFLKDQYGQPYSASNLPGKAITGIEKLSVSYTPTGTQAYKQIDKEVNVNFSGETTTIDVIPYSQAILIEDMKEGNLTLQSSYLSNMAPTKYDGNDINVESTNEGFLNS